MKFSFQWLNDFICLKEYTPEGLAEQLSLKGLDVEGIQTQKWDHIVVGQIVSQKKHPNADQLQLCLVQGEDKEPLSIVCGAKNQKEGDKVVLCLKGAVLPNGLKILNRKIRGQASQGMLASREELGWPSSSDKGIWILPKTAVVGQRFDEFLGVKDSLLDIAIAPNRPDLLSHIGFARELSGLFNKPLKLDHVFWLNSYKNKVSLLEVSEKKIQISGKKRFEPRFSSKNIHKKVCIHEKELCPFYQYRIMLNVEVKESPLWLKKRLEFLGLKSINNVVDATNWVLLEWGQPLHAFDLDFLEGDVHIRKTQAKTKLETLDQQCIEFSGEELVISDSKKTLALAGIIGGKDSAIQNSTQNILIESAVFDPYATRRTARKFGFTTLSAFHFSRGVFPQTTELALERVCQLIQETAGGEIVKNQGGESYNVIPEKTVIPAKNNNPAKNVIPAKAGISNKKSSPSTGIEISEQDLSERLGYAVSLPEFRQWMESMHLSVEQQKSKVCVQPPYYRTDLRIKEDLIEEWARLKGYDYVPETLPLIHFKREEDSEELVLLDDIRKRAKEQGFYQAINTSFANQNVQEKFLGSQWSEETPVFIQNPMNSEENVLRQSLLPGLFKNLLINVRHGQNWGKLFEQGEAFFKTKEGSFIEKTFLAFMLWGRKKNIWQTPKQGFLFFDLKSSVESVLERAGYSSWLWKNLEGDYPFFHPKKRQALVIQGQRMGFIGVLNPLLHENNKIREEAVLGEIDISLLIRLPKKPFLFKKLSNMPIVHRDISLVMNQSQAVEGVFQVIHEKKPSFCKSIRVIDCYEGKGLVKGQRSVTFRLSFQGQAETLSEKQIAKYMKNISEALLKKLSVQIR